MRIKIKHSYLKPENPSYTPSYTTPCKLPTTAPCSLPMPCHQRRARHHHVLAPPGARSPCRVTRAMLGTTMRSLPLPRPPVPNCIPLAPSFWNSHPIPLSPPVLPFRVFIRTAAPLTFTSRPQIHSVAPSFRWNHQKLAQQPLCQLNENPRTRGAFGNKQTVYLSQICAECDGIIYPHFWVKNGHMNKGKWLGKPSYPFFSAIYRGVITPYNNSFHGAFGYSKMPS